MEDKIRRDIAALFDEGYISLDVLNNVKEKEEYVSLNILDVKTEGGVINLSVLDKPVAVKKEKCLHLSPLFNCNVGGFGHLGCMDPVFHNHCKFKLLYEKKFRSV